MSREMSKNTMSVDEKSPSSQPVSRSSSLSVADNANTTAQPMVESKQETIIAGPKLLAVLGGLVLVILMISLDVTIVATAIPFITDHFGTVKDIGWYGSSYVICNAALQPLTGKIYSYFSLTYTYLVFVAIFELGSLICALATSSTMLVLGRAVGGIGSSGLMNGAMTMIGVAATPDQRPMLLAIIMACFGCGQILGPIIGGVLTQHASWRWCFWINLPIGACAALVLFLIRVQNPNQRKGLTSKTFIGLFDIVGFVQFAPACVMLLMALEWGGIQYAWNSATIIGLLCGSAATFIIFIYWEWRKGDTAMFPSAIMGKQVIWSSCLTSTFTAGSVFVVAYYLPLWFQAVQRNSPTTSAVHVIGVFVTQIIGGIFSAVVVKKIGYYTPFAILGSALIAIGCGLMSTFTPAAGIGKWLGFQIMVGIGRGFVMQQPIIAIQANITGDQMSTGMAIIAWSQLFGGAIFISLAQTVFTSVLRSVIPTFAPGINPFAVLGAGATKYLLLATNPSQYRGLLISYNLAVTRTYYLGAGAAAAATIAATFMGYNKILQPVKKEKPPKV